MSSKSKTNKKQNNKLEPKQLENRSEPKLETKQLEPKKQLTADELRKLSMQVIENVDLVYDLDEDTTHQLRAYMNPLGNILNSKQIFVNMSIVNWKDQWLKKLHLTSLVGYLYRTVEEYEPETELDRETDRYNSEIAELEKGTLTKDQQYEQKQILYNSHEQRKKRITQTIRGVVKTYLNRNFNYNPDHHVRSAHTSNVEDLDRRDKLAHIKSVCSVVTNNTNDTNQKTKQQVIDEKLEAKVEPTYKYVREQLLATYQLSRQSTEAMKSILGIIIDDSLSAQDKQGILLKNYARMMQITEDLEKLAAPLSTADTLVAWKIDPPADVFHHFTRYLNNHYEQLCDCVTALYNEKADIEFAIIPHSSHKTAEAAKEFRTQHESEIKTDVFCVESGKINLLGPFKENRERVDYYNKNTKVLELINSQIDADHKLGQDIMKKQVVKKKTKNILEAGPDHPALAAYSKQMNLASELGATKGVTREEQDRIIREQKAAIREAENIKEQFECVDDAIMTEIIFPEQDANGETVLNKKIMYTRAEAPEHMADPNAQVDSYQPISKKSTKTTLQIDDITMKSSKK